MGDFFQKVDISNLTTFTLVPFGAPMAAQALDNESGLAVEVSFDGTNVHMVLAASGATQAVSWGDGVPHLRPGVYLRRQTGTGGGPLYVNVSAGT
jgi:hypothetical protein